MSPGFCQPTQQMIKMIPRCSASALNAESLQMPPEPQTRLTQNHGCCWLAKRLQKLRLRSLLIPAIEAMCFGLQGFPFRYPVWTSGMNFALSPPYPVPGTR